MDAGNLKTARLLEQTKLIELYCLMCRLYDSQSYLKY